MAAAAPGGDASRRGRPPAPFPRRLAPVPHVATYAALGLIGCTDATTPPIDCSTPDAAAGVQLRAATPEDGELRDLVDGTVVALTAGPQGGQHLWLQVLGHDLCPNRPRVQYRFVRAADGAPIGAGVMAARWSEVPGASGRYATGRFAAVLDDNAYCTVLAGGVVRLEVQVDDGAGQMAAAHVAVVVRGWTPDTRTTLRDARDECCANASDRRCWPAGPADGGGTPDE